MENSKEQTQSKKDTDIIGIINNYALYNQYELVKEANEQENAKYNSLKQRVMQFEAISTKKEAIELSERIMPVKNGITSFTAGMGKCTVINRADLFRITLDSPKEFISYNFIK